MKTPSKFFLLTIAAAKDAKSAKLENPDSYGKLGLGINTDIVKNGAVFVMLNAYVNPAASRNLEMNPALVTEARP